MEHFAAVDTLDKFILGYRQPFTEKQTNMQYEEIRLLRVTVYWKLDS